MKYDLLHIQGKPYVLVPLHEYRALTSNEGEGDLPDAIMDEIIAGQDSAIKILREYRGMTQSDLAQLAGLSRSYLTEIETGKKDGSVRALKSIADALNAPVGLLAA